MSLIRNIIEVEPNYVSSICFSEGIYSYQHAKQACKFSTTEDTFFFIKEGSQSLRPVILTGFELGTTTCTER